MRNSSSTTVIFDITTDRDRLVAARNAEEETAAMRAETIESIFILRYFFFIFPIMMQL
jgi:hypothetical protein